jgi:tRNA(Ile2) C34 agmatinyltransferase TiaS
MHAPFGDTSLMVGMEVPTCEECGSHMEPRVFFGHVYGWRCPQCNPLGQKCWSMKNETGKN